MLATAQNVIKAEYFIDTDLGFGNNKIINFANTQPDATHNFIIDLTGISAGYHKLYIRILDSDGKWSHTTRRTIEIIKGYAPVINAAEFFFNTDPGFGNATAVTFSLPSTDSNFTFKIPLSKIPTGAHTLYIRARDSTSNNWSITQWQKDTIVTSTGADSLWSNPASWSSNAIPDSNTIVIIHHPVTVDVDEAHCKSLAPYKNVAKLTVPPGKKLRIYGRRRN
jgi:hypothetical protein